jgi:hypothetical protein
MSKTPSHGIRSPASRQIISPQFHRPKSYESSGTNDNHQPVIDGEFTELTSSGVASLAAVTTPPPTRLPNGTAFHVSRRLIVIPTAKLTTAATMGSVT